MTTTTNNLAIARTIRSQIQMGVAMSLGMRDTVAIDRGLRSRVANGRVWIEITLNAMDLYDIVVFRVRRGTDRIELHAAHHVHVEDFNAALLRAEREGWGS